MCHITPCISKSLIRANFIEHHHLCVPMHRQTYQSRVPLLLPSTAIIEFVLKVTICYSRAMDITLCWQHIFGMFWHQASIRIAQKYFARNKMQKKLQYANERPKIMRLSCRYLLVMYHDNRYQDCRSLDSHIGCRLHLKFELLIAFWICRYVGMLLTLCCSAWEQTTGCKNATTQCNLPIHTDIRHCYLWQWRHWDRFFQYILTWLTQYFLHLWVCHGLRESHRCCGITWQF